ncbi:MAG TPA: OmpA family protein [Roseococcus sp.]|jgi:outer membrane protein OmpA-like peptidoglycan-associated protein|nr:OmpA family protein [Roseococcus sp.]
MRPTLLALPLLFAGAALGHPALAQPVVDLVVEPYAGSTEREGDRREEEFGATARITGFAGGEVQAAPFEGRLLLRRFSHPRDRSTLEILENYRQALAARGFVEEWSCAGRAACGNTSDGGWNRRNGMNLGVGSDVRYLTGSLPHQGGRAFVSVGVERANHYVQVLQPRAMETGRVAVVDAARMASALEAEGRIALENIHFEFGSAALLPSSTPALEQIARLLEARPQLRVYVVGHTDSVGGLEANLALSRARAEAVVAALAGQFRIAAGRAVPAGVGPLAPLATNATEAGRAQNRRVEVVAR